MYSLLFTCSSYLIFIYFTFMNLVTVPSSYSCLNYSLFFMSLLFFHNNPYQYFLSHNFCLPFAYNPYITTVTVGKVLSFDLFLDIMCLWLPTITSILVVTPSFNGKKNFGSHITQPPSSSISNSLRHCLSSLYCRSGTSFHI